MGSYSYLQSSTDRNVLSCCLSFESCALTLGNGSARTARVMCLECKEHELFLADSHTYISIHARFNVLKQKEIGCCIGLKMNVPNDIQIQVDFRGIKRAFVTSEPQSYGEFLSLIHSHVKNVNISASCLMYENDERDLVLLATDDNSLSIAVMSSRKIPGIDLKRLNLKVLECTSPSSAAQDRSNTSGKTSADVDNITHSLSFGMKEQSPGPSNVSLAETRGRFDYKMPPSTVVLSSITARRKKN